MAPVARVLVTRALPGEALERLAATHEVDVWEGEMPPDPDTLRARAANADGLLSLLTDRVDAELLAAAPRLRAIANYAIGTDNIDLAAARERGIPVGVTPDVLTEATADLTWALILAVARRLPEAAAAVHADAWRTWEPQNWLGMELHRATLGLVGYGRIGRAVARRSAGFGMRLLVAKRGDDAALARLLEQADVVSIHCPLTEETRGLIDERALARMKPTSILVNTARGPIVDTGALAAALHAGAIAGAGLDVTDPEPMRADHPLLRAPNLLVLPHVGSATHTARARMADLAVDNLLAGLAGEPMPHPAG
jgi:glyoxylate reductase